MTTFVGISAIGECDSICADLSGGCCCSCPSPPPLCAADAKTGEGVLKPRLILNLSTNVENTDVSTIEKNEKKFQTSKRFKAITFKS